MEAVKVMVRNKVALVQGPPGTGKTHVAGLFARILYQNRLSFDSRPVIIVCYTNHALDQLLNHILKFTQNVVRVGGRSKDENMAKYSLFNLSKNQVNRRIKSFANLCRISEEIDDCVKKSYASSISLTTQYVGSSEEGRKFLDTMVQ
jgi:superfamily II DNA or RNA helicase